MGQTTSFHGGDERGAERGSAGTSGQRPDTPVPRGPAGTVGQCLTPRTPP